MKPTVTNYDLHENVIVCEVKCAGREFDIEITRDDFELWLFENDKLKYSVVHTVLWGQTAESEHVMDLDDYWSTNLNVKSDLLEYMRTNKVVHGNTTHANLFEFLSWSLSERFNKVA